MKKGILISCIVLFGLVVHANAMNTQHLDIVQDTDEDENPLCLNVIPDVSEDGIALIWECFIKREGFRHIDPDGASVYVALLCAIEKNKSAVLSSYVDLLKEEDPQIRMPETNIQTLDMLLYANFDYSCKRTGAFRSIEADFIVRAAMKYRLVQILSYCMANLMVLAYLQGNSPLWQDFSAFVAQLASEGEIQPLTVYTVMKAYERKATETLDNLVASTFGESTDYRLTMLSDVAVKH